MEKRRNSTQECLVRLLLAGASLLVWSGNSHGQMVLSVPNVAGTNDTTAQNPTLNDPQPVSILPPALTTPTNTSGPNTVTAAQNTLIQGEPGPEELLARDVANNRRPVQRENIAAPVVEAGVTPAVETDPFAPAGINLGSLRLTTFVKQSLGYSTNRQNASDGTGGVVSRTELNLNLLSQWQRHELSLTANGTYDTYFDNTIESQPQAAINGNLRLDLVDGFTLRLGGNYGFARESATSPSLTQSAIDQPGVHTFETFAELQRTGGNIDMTLRASISRTQYEDATLSDGTIFSQGDRNVNAYGLRTRLAYQSGLAFSPFVQFDYANNVFDWLVDRNGDQRDSQFYELRGGVAISLGEKVTGEISAGYATQEFSDGGLAALAGFVADANINWSPYRDTNIAFTFGSDFGGSTTSGDSGAITYNGTIGAARRIRDNLEVTGELGLSYTNFEGLNRIDTTYVAQTGFEYWLNRTFSVTGDVRYEALDSTVSSNSYEAATIMLGIKAQH